MIVWLASYPKSGNTWVRVFLSSLLFSKDQTREIDINKNHITQFPLKSQFTNLVEDFLSMDQITSNCYEKTFTWNWMSIKINIIIF